MMPTRIIAITSSAGWHIPLKEQRDIGSPVVLNAIHTDRPPCPPGPCYAQTIRPVAPVIGAGCIFDGETLDDAGGVRPWEGYGILQKNTLSGLQKEGLHLPDTFPHITAVIIAILPSDSINQHVS